MNRITRCLNNLKNTGRKALVPYVVSGDPQLTTTVPAMHALVEAGADILEIGVPFSDPTAEGPVIQLAHERALAHGTSLRATLELVAEFRETDKDTPVVLMGYANPLERMGYENFIAAAIEVGVDGVLTVDLPPEESAKFTDKLKQAGLENIFLVAPTTTAERMSDIAKQAGGYIYYVSLKGVTGAGHLDLQSVQQGIDGLRSVTDLPVCVGFGIKDAETAQSIASIADGAVVGSIIVDTIAGHDNTEQGVEAAAKLVREMRAAMDK